MNRLLQYFVLFWLATAASLHAQEVSSGKICVAPILHKQTTAATLELFCKSGNFSLRIDSGPPMVWPKEKSVSVTGLGLKGTHRVTVLCDGKPHQQFTFRFSEYKSGKACLFLNDLYWTAQMWEPKKAPWCKCKE